MRMRLTAPRKSLVLLALACAALWLAVRFSPHLFPPAPPPEPGQPPPPIVAAPDVPTWKEAARRVEEPRGAPVGRAARASIPPALRHYADTRRFLAVQVAETREHDLDLPHDWAELAHMVQDDELVAVKPLGEDHILYGVGGSASDQPFTHFDRTTGLAIPLYDGWADFKDAEAAALEKEAALKADAARKRAQVRKLSRKLRTRRRALQREASSLEAQASASARRRARTAWFYEDQPRRRSLVAEHVLLRALAEGFGDRSYDLENPRQRLLLKGRLLSHLRPEAHDLMRELAADYRRVFGRPLPVSSLVRPLDYQAAVGRTNPNATRIEEPPHATGLAFDVYYGHMAADEQEHVMATLARLEAEGRLEALRENLNHFHVFVFPDGRPPAERLIVDSLDDVRPTARVATRTAARAKAPARRAAATRSGGGKAAAARKPAPRRP
jgi:hypothetical protein